MTAQTKFETLISVPQLCLLLSGINVGTKIRNGLLRNFVESCLFLFNISWLYVDVVGELLWIAEGIRLDRSFEDISLMVPCATVSMLGTIKAAPLYLRKKSLIKLVNFLTKIHPNDVLDTTDEEPDEVTETVRRIAKTANEHFKKIIHVFHWMSIPVFLAFCMSPILSMAYEYFLTGATEIKLPFLVHYGVDTSRIWPLVYLHHVYSTLIAIWNVFGADCLFYGCCNFIQMHFQIIGVQLEHLIPLEWNRSAEVTRRKFRDIVRRHQDLTDIVLEMERLYSFSTLYNFVSSSFLICLSGFIVTSPQDLNTVLTFLSFLLMSLAQISILCYGGNIIMQSSQDISQAVYNSKWYLADEAMKRSMLLLLVRAQKPCKLTAADFADLNLSAFSTVIRRSWSYFALLKTIYH